MAMTILTSAVRKVLLLFSCAAVLFSGVFGGTFSRSLKPIDPDKVKLNFAALSDIHLTDSSFRQMILELGLQDFDNAKSKLDAVLFCGDNTDGGQKEQYERLASSIAKYDIAKNILFANGNHDTWSEEGTYDLAKTYFTYYASKITGMDIQNEFYSKKINGYTFIVLGSQWRLTAAYFTDEQLDWLAEQMEVASADGKPIFVISHWPINQTHGLPFTFEGTTSDPTKGGMGMNSDAVNDILQRYKNVFLISGHIHSGFSNEPFGKNRDYASIEKVGNVWSVNLPSYMYPSLHGHMMNGTGFVFEVYEDDVVIRARNFVFGMWLDQYRKNIELV